METTCEKTLKLAARFFHELPQDAKEAIHMKHNKYYRGYEPPCHTSVGDFTSKETKEAFNWGYEAGLDPTGGDGKYVELDGSKDGGKNLWPDENLLPGFYDGIAEYYGKVSSPPYLVASLTLILIEHRSWNSVGIYFASLPYRSHSQKTISSPSLLIPEASLA